MRFKIPLTILPILAVLILSGCSAMDWASESLSGVKDYFTGGADNSEPPSPLVEYNPEIQAQVVWKENVGVGTDEQTLKLVPAIGNGKIYAADRDGLVQARDLTTGNLAWEVEIEDQNEDAVHFSGGAGLGATAVILGSNNGEVIALSAENGSVLWKTPVSSEVMSVPVVASGIAIIRTTDGSVIALNEKTGQKVWSYEHNVPALTVRGTGTPLIIEDTLIEGYDNGKLMALRLEDGKYVWESSVTIPKGRSEVERLVDIDVDPIESRGVIYTASYNGGSAAVSILDGDVLWRNEAVSSHTGLSQDEQYLYISNSDGHVLQLDKRTGSSLWEQKDLHGRRLTSPVAYQGNVVVGDVEGYVHWLSSTDGRQLARVQVAGDAIDAKPVVVGDTVYIYAKDGTLAALKAQ
ncbi:outer membrane protein assembly factor BamB [Methyloglobulus sp.]|uniref:outer membrane protein assembly factor BamB n=1 Tax=Methyloglobulus sp. TaxID=2518622 RepID=UPI0032B7FE2F